MPQYMKFSTLVKKAVVGQKFRKVGLGSRGERVCVIGALALYLGKTKIGPHEGVYTDDAVEYVEDHFPQGVKVPGGRGNLGKLLWELVEMNDKEETKGFADIITFVKQKEEKEKHEHEAQ
jgi:hypothetical protein